MDHYPQPMCNGVLEGSGKGGGPRSGRSTTRHQTVYAFRAWGKSGTDLYFSSRWDKNWQIYDHFWSPKSIDEWWTTKTWQYVFVGEVPFDILQNDFEWEHAARTMSMRQLRAKLFWQKKRALR